MSKGSTFAILATLLAACQPEFPQESPTCAPVVECDTMEVCLAVCLAVDAASVDRCYVNFDSCQLPNTVSCCQNMFQDCMGAAIYAQMRCEAECQELTQ